jgi:predicted AAA+ superfamily ATPase
VRRPLAAPIVEYEVMDSEFLFPGLNFPADLVLDLRRLNPWWEGKPGLLLPPMRRTLVGMIQRRLKLRLAPVIVVRGPRQIGKTTAQLHVIEDLLAGGVAAERICRVQFDDIPSFGGLAEPILRIVDWYESVVLRRSLNEAAHAGQPAYLFFDEIQNLADWAPQLKSLTDAAAVQVVVTGSSALRIELGRDSLAGRITTIEAGTLSLTEIGNFRGLSMPPAFLPDNGLEPLTRKSFWLDLRSHGSGRRVERDVAFAAFSERGAYPLVHQAAQVEWPQIADQLNETVIRRVIQHDLPLVNGVASVTRPCSRSCSGYLAGTSGRRQTAGCWRARRSGPCRQTWVQCGSNSTCASWQTRCC